MNGADLEFIDKASGTVVFAFRKMAGSLPCESTQDTMTAFSTGGQTNGTPITAAISRFTTVAAGNDSGLLPVSVPGMSVTVINAAAANSMNVFPQSGDKINALSANAAFALAANKTATFYCVTAGQWHAQLTA
jgi:hypothetical protein